MVKRLLQRILGGNTATKGEVNREISPTLSDENYEFLFLQLLEGVAHGWQPARVQKFFEGLGSRGEGALWIEWLNRYGQTLTTATTPNRQLAQRMLRLREQTKHLPQLKDFGEKARNIGTRLLSRDKMNPIWEYDGPDASGVASGNDGEKLTLPELLERLQQDSNLLEQVAQQLGIDPQEPETVMETLKAQIQNLNQNILQTSGEIPTPKKPEDWFNKGLQQINQQDFEGAIASWEKAIELQPDFLEAWHNRGSALGYLGRYEEALKSYEKVLEYQSENPETWIAHGKVLQNLGRTQDAIASYDQALKLQPNHPEATKSREQALNSLSS